MSNGNFNLGAAARHVLRGFKPEVAEAAGADTQTIKIRGTRTTSRCAKVGVAPCRILRTHGSEGNVFGIKKNPRSSRGSER